MRAKTKNGQAKKTRQQQAFSLTHQQQKVVAAAHSIYRPDDDLAIFFQRVQSVKEKNGLHVVMFRKDAWGVTESELDLFESSQLVANC